MNTAHRTPNRYTAFYLTLLILSTTGTGIAILCAPFSLFDILKFISVSPVYAAALIAMNIIILLSAVALILLWLKRQSGIVLALVGYCLSVVSTIMVYFGITPVTRVYAQEIVRESPQISFAGASDLMTMLWIGAIIISVLIEITMAVLWWQAWKSQRKADSISN